MLGQQQPQPGRHPDARARLGTLPAMAVSHGYYTRRSARTQWRGAGVLPLARDAETGETLCLLGGEPGRRRPPGTPPSGPPPLLWSDFGGRREAGDACPAATAARECAEESLGLFFGGLAVNAAAITASAAEIRRRLGRRPGGWAASGRAGGYGLFALALPTIDPLYLSLAAAANAASGAVPGGCEKAAFAWVPLADVVAAAKSGVRVGRAGGRGRAARAALGGPLCPTLRPIRLHPFFAASLRAAEVGGVLAAAEAELGEEGKKGSQGDGPRLPAPLPADRRLPAPPATASGASSPRPGSSPDHTLYHWWRALAAECRSGGTGGGASRAAL